MIKRRELSDLKHSRSSIVTKAERQVKIGDERVDFDDVENVDVRALELKHSIAED